MQHLSVFYFREIILCFQTLVNRMGIPSGIYREFLVWERLNCMILLEKGGLTVSMHKNRSPQYPKQAVLVSWASVFFMGYFISKLFAIFQVL